MSVFKPEPFSSDVNRLFNTLFSGTEDRPERWTPAMDLVEADDHFVLKADLPGLGEDDISIEIQDNTLTVSGERRSEHEERERGWYRVERSFGRFSRSLTLPEGVNPEAVNASFDRGVLSIRIPKPEERKPRRVTISASGQRVEHPAVEGLATEQPAGAPPAGGGSTGTEPTGPGIAPGAPPVEAQSGSGRGPFAPVAGGEHDQEGEGPQAGQSARPVDTTTGAQHPAEQGAKPSPPRHDDESDVGDDDDLSDNEAFGTLGDSSSRGEPMLGRPEETAGTPDPSWDMKITGRGGLDREQSVSEPNVVRDELGDAPTEGQQRREARGYDQGEPHDQAGDVGSPEEKAGLAPDTPDAAVPETPEEHPDPGEHPPSQGPV